MARDANIPIFLWVATAALAHILWGGGADQVAQVVESKTQVRAFAASVQRHVNRASRPLEVALLTDQELMDLERRSPAVQDGPESDLDPDTEETEPVLDRPSESLEQAPVNKAKQQDSLEKAKPSKQDQKEPAKKEPETEKLKAKPEQVKPLSEQELARLRQRRRIAVEQHVKDKEQKDNPNAEFIGEHANHAAEQSQARITSTDQNDPAPSPGSNHHGAHPEPGNALVTEVAQADSQSGDPDEAPAEDGKSSDGKKAQAASMGAASQGDNKAVVQEERAAVQPAQRSLGSEGQKAQRAQTASEESAESINAPAASWSAPSHSEQREARRAQRQFRHRQSRAGQAQGKGGRSLGALATTPGGLNPNLTTAMALGAIGAQRLQEERRADGERRRSKHRGSWHIAGLEKWRSALENYIPNIKPGNQTNLNTAHSPFASYIHRIHNRLHGQFAVRVHQQLDRLPSNHALNDPRLWTKLEIVLDPANGRVVKMGVIRSSGNTAFDVEPLEAVQRASPFGPSPREIISPDGRVYLTWSFHRDATACATYYAQPYILRTAPKTAPPSSPPFKEKTPPVERQRHGKRQDPSHHREG